MDNKEFDFSTEDVFDENGKFQERGMEEKFKMFQLKLKVRILSENPHLKERQAKKIAEEVIYELFEKALKSPDASKQIKAWFWWKHNGDVVNALFIGTLLGIFLKLFV